MKEPIMTYAVDLMDVYRTTVYIKADNEEKALETAKKMQIAWVTQTPERTIGAIKCKVSDPIQSFVNGQKVKVLLGRIWVDGFFDRTLWQPGWSKAKHAVVVNGLKYFVGKNDVKEIE